MDKHTLTLVFESPQGKGVLQVPPEHPLIGGFRVLIERGRPPGKGAFLLARDTETNDVRIFGMFVLSVYDRLLFFPASSGEIETADRMGRFGGTILDHVTLDRPTTKGKHKSHIAVRGLSGKTRGHSITSAPPPDHLIPWFSVLVPSLDLFPHLPQRLLVHFSPPRPDPQHVARLLAEMTNLSLVPLPSPAASPDFVQFDVWAGRGVDWRGLKAKALAWAYKPGVVEELPERQQVISNQVDVEFTPTAGVRVILSRPAGRLKSSRFFRPSSV